MVDAPIDHVAILVEDLDATAKLYSETLGFSIVGRETLPDQEVEVISLRSGTGMIELVKVLNRESSLERYRDGESMKLHHVGFRVDDVAAELERLRAAGLRPVDQRPRRGANGTLVALVHPKSTGGLMIELCQRASG